MNNNNNNNNNNEETIIIKKLPNYLYKKIIGYVLEFLKYCIPNGSGPNYLKSLIGENIKRLMLVNREWYYSWVTDSLLYLPEFKAHSDFGKFRLPWFQQLLSKQYKFLSVSSKTLDTQPQIVELAVFTNPIVKINKNQLLKYSKNIVSLTIDNESSFYKDCDFHSIRLPLFQNITKLFMQFDIPQHWYEFIELIKPIKTGGQYQVVGANIEILSLRFSAIKQNQIPLIDLTCFNETIKLGGLINLSKLFIMDSGPNGLTGFKNSLLCKQLTSLAIYSCKEVNCNQLVDLISSSSSPSSKTTKETSTCKLEKLEIKNCTGIDSNLILDAINNSFNKLKYYNDSPSITPRDSPSITVSKAQSFLTNLSNNIEKVVLLRTITSDSNTISPPPPPPSSSSQIQQNLDNFIWNNDNDNNKNNNNNNNNNIKKDEKLICNIEQLSLMTLFPILSLPVLRDIEFKNLRSLEIKFTEVDDIDILVDGCMNVLINLVRLKISSDYELRPITNKFYEMIGKSKSIVELILIGFKFTSIDLIAFLNKFHPTLEFLSLEGETDTNDTDLKKVFCNENSKITSLDLQLTFTNFKSPIHSYQLLLDLLLINKFYHLSFITQNTTQIKSIPTDQLINAIKSSDKLLTLSTGQFNPIANIISKTCYDCGKSNYFNPPTTLKYYSWSN
ncbi:hypothetical protein ACTFIW_004361 [Dictyostelium discoideum]